MLWLVLFVWCVSSDLIRAVLLSIPHRSSWLICTPLISVCISALQSRHWASWRLLANKITWSLSGPVFFTRLLSNTTEMHSLLCVDRNLFSTVYHRVTTGSHWDSSIRLRHSAECMLYLHAVHASVLVLLSFCRSPVAIDGSRFNHLTSAWSECLHHWFSPEKQCFLRLKCHGTRIRLFLSMPSTPFEKDWENLVRTAQEVWPPMDSQLLMS